MTVGWKGGKTKNRFPSLTTALGNRCCDSHIPTGRRLFHLSQNRKPKGVPRYRPSFLTSGSFFDENMLKRTPALKSCAYLPKSVGIQLDRERTCFGSHHDLN